MNISSVSLYLLLMLLVGAGIIIVSVVAYNRRLDRITNGELRDTHSAIPEPRTTVDAIYKGALMAIAVVSLLNISTVSGMLISMQNTVGSLQSKQNQLYDELVTLRREMSERDSLVASSGWEIAGADPERLTAEVLYSIRLRQYSDGTAVSLQLGERSVPLSRDAQGGFSGRFTADIFEDWTEPVICVTENGVTVTEPADFPGQLFWEVLPMPGYACTFSSNTAFGKLTYDGEYTVTLNDPGAVASASVTYMTSGRDLKTLDITKAVQNGEKIAMEKDLPLDKDLTFRLELVTKDGIAIEQQSVMIYDTSADLDGMEFLRIRDTAGRVVWEDADRVLR